MNWNITRIVEKSIKPTLKGLDPNVTAGLENAALKADLITEVIRKAQQANPNPATIDILAWGWPMAVWPKPSTLSLAGKKGLSRTVLLLHNYVFDGEVRTGDVTSIPYIVLLITMVAAICFAGILVPCLRVMGSKEQVKFVPCWLGCVVLGIPFVVLAIIGPTVEAVSTGASGWEGHGCNLVEYAGAALRPFWVSRVLSSWTRLIEAVLK